MVAILCIEDGYIHEGDKLSQCWGNYDINDEGYVLVVLGLSQGFEIVQSYRYLQPGYGSFLYLSILC